MQQIVILGGGAAGMAAALAAAQAAGSAARITLLDRNPASYTHPTPPTSDPV